MDRPQTNRCEHVSLLCVRACVRVHLLWRCSNGTHTRALPTTPTQHRAKELFQLRPPHAHSRPPARDEPVTCSTPAHTLSSPSAHLTTPVVNPYPLFTLCRNRFQIILKPPINLTSLPSPFPIHPPHPYDPYNPRALSHSVALTSQTLSYTHR